MQILCAGDFHIGRRPTRLPPEAGVGLSAAQAWQDLVALALERSVDLVVLTGDVVDRDNRYFEAFGPLEAGLDALARARIPVAAVAGNHDYDVLPRLAESFPGNFHLIGAGGRWERVTLATKGGTVHLDGWSFPREHVTSDPLAAYALAPPREGLWLGLLHGDLDQPGSHYAPLTMEGLRQAGPVAWLLGHIHSPRLISAGAGADLLYPGSPLALSPKEPGPHGPWLLEVGGDGRLRFEHLPRSRVRYEVVEVDLTGVETEEAIRPRVAEAVRERLEGVLVEAGEHLQHLLCRIRATGRTRLHRRVARAIEPAVEDLAIRRGQVVATVESVVVDTRPVWDLAGLAAGSGPPAVLARLLLILQEGEASPQRAELLTEARTVLKGLAGRPPYGLLDRDPAAEVAPDDEALARLVERQGWLLLDELLAQGGGGEPFAAGEA